MRTFIPVLLSLFVFFPRLVLAADDGVLCVQNQLVAAGYDPGPVDGQLGSQTMQAYRAYNNRYGLSARAPLEPGNAVTWCRRMGLGDAELRRFWPSAQAPVNLVFAGGVHDTVRHVLEEWLPLSHTRAAEVFGLDIAGTDTVIVGASLAELEQMVPRYLPDRVRWSRLGDALEAQCDNPRQFGAFTVPGITVICVPPDLATGHRLPPADLYDAAAHEALHLIARQVLGIYPDDAAEGQRPEIDGPKWFHEGVAMVFADFFVTGRDIVETRAEMVRRLRGRPMMRLQDLQTREAVLDHNAQVYLVGAMAASHLVERHGFEAVGQVFDLMGQGVHFSQAFERQFGQSLEDFYRRFNVGGAPFPPAGQRTAQTDGVNRDGAAQLAAAMCVQRQLNAASGAHLGIDGHVGPRTQRAFQTYAQSSGLAVDVAFGPETVWHWCRRIGVQDLELRAYWPDGMHGIEVLIAPGMDPAVAEAFRTRLPDVFGQVVALLGLEPSDTARFFIAAAPGPLRDLLTQTTGREPRSGQETWINDTCAGARLAASLTGNSETLVCARPGFRMTDDRAEDRLQRSMIRMATRQIFHLMVSPASRGLRGNARRAAEGPLWLREGLITLLGRVQLAGYSGHSFRSGVMTRYENTPLPALRDQEIRGAATAERAVVNDIGALAVSMLVDDYDMETVGRWISAIGGATPYELAFEDIFGQTLEAFYAAFDLRISRQRGRPEDVRTPDATRNSPPRRTVGRSVGR